MFKWLKPKDSVIEFFCNQEDWDVIPKPYPAYKNIPNWFKALPPKLDNKGFNTSTIKRCNPFLDALSIGYIMPLAADVFMSTTEDASGTSYSWKFHKPMIENHSLEQVTTKKEPNPMVPKPPMKWMNYWHIKVPEEYSLLFTMPLNRDEKRFTCYSGVVDAPYSELEYVNFPFFFNTANFSGLISAGTPLVQVIPIRKDSLLETHKTRNITNEEIKNRDHLRFTRNTVHESIYRDNIHKKV